MGSQQGPKQVGKRFKHTTEEVLQMEVNWMVASVGTQFRGVHQTPDLQPVLPA